MSQDQTNRRGFFGWLAGVVAGVWGAGKAAKAESADTKTEPLITYNKFTFIGVRKIPFENLLKHCNDGLYAGPELGMLPVRNQLESMDPISGTGNKMLARHALRASIRTPARFSDRIHGLAMAAAYSFKVKVPAIGRISVTSEPSINANFEESTDTSIAIEWHTVE